MEQQYLEVNDWVVQETLFCRGICGLAGKIAQGKRDTTQLPFIVVMNKKCLLPDYFWIFCNLAVEWRGIWKKLPSVLCHLFSLFSAKEPAKLSLLGSCLYRKWGLAFTIYVQLPVRIYPVLSESGTHEISVFAITEGGEKTEIPSLRCGSDTQEIKV